MRPARFRDLGRLHLVRAFLLLLALLPVLLSSGSAMAEPLRMHFGLYVKSLEVQDQEQRFTADFYYWLRFQKPETAEELEDLKAIEFVNGELDSELTHIQDEHDIGSEHYVTGRAKGTFTFDARYASYPFDKQHLPILVEHSALTSDQLVMVEDTASYGRSKADPRLRGLDKDVSAGSLEIVKAGFVSGEREYASDFGDLANPPHSTYSRLAYTIEVERRWGPYVLKFLVPLIIILSLAYLVFFIPADQLDLASTLTVTSILAAIAFQITLNGEVPKVGYLTCVDKIFYLTYGLIMLALVQTVWTYHLEKEGRVRFADQLEVLGRWAFPALFVGVSVLVMGLAARAG